MFGKSRKWSCIVSNDMSIQDLRREFGHAHDAVKKLRRAGDPSLTAEDAQALLVELHVDQIMLEVRKTEKPRR